jgi:phage terminase large subunit-like protein
MNYRLEFSEEQQWLRCDNGTHDPNTNGFVTIFENVTDLEQKVFEAFTNRIKKSKMTAKQLINDANEFKAFMQALSEYGIGLDFKFPSK